MFGFEIVRKRDMERIREELKGYYAADGGNRDNYYLSAIAQTNGMRTLPPVMPISRSQVLQLYLTSAPVMGVVNYIADNVGEVMRYLELKDLRTGKYVEKHWLLDLIRRPNDRFTTRRFGSAWAVNKLLYSDAFVYTVRNVGKDRNIRQMYVMSGHRIATESGGPDNPFAGIRILGVPKDRLITPEDVFQSFDYNPDDDTFFGPSRIVAAATYLSVMDKGMRREDTSLENGGVANIITPKPDNTGSVLPSVQEDIDKGFNNRSAFGKTKALRFPVEVHALGSNPVDLNILASHKEAVTALCFVYKIPVDLYYGQSKYENAKEAKKAIYELSAIPMANEFAEDLLNFCGLSEQYSLEVNTERIEVLRQSSTDTLAALEKMNASVNEKRMAMGYDMIPEEWADKPMIPVGMQFGYENPYDILSE